VVVKKQQKATYVGLYAVISRYLIDTRIDFRCWRQ